MHASRASSSQSFLDAFQSEPSTARDSTALGRFSEDIDESGRLLLQGDWAGLWDKLYAGTVNFAVEFVPKLVLALLTLALLYVTYRFIGKGLDQLLERGRRIDAGLHNLLLKTYRVVALAFITVVVLDLLQFNITALIAGLSIVGIAVGFAARDSLENFISGITILTDRPFRVGDNIEINGKFGSVEEITLRSTRVRTLNNQILVMPNLQMITQELINHTMLKTIRIEVPFGIAYKERPAEARAVVLALAEGDDRLHPDYKPAVVVTGLNASSVDMSMRLYLRNPKLEIAIRFEYIEKVREALREADIEIPFPHLQLFVDEAKAFEGSHLLRSAQGNGHGEAVPRGEETEEAERRGDGETAKS